MEVELKQAVSKSESGKLTPVEIDGETFYKIADADDMRPFFMSIVSDSNHWMFIASNGGISAGRKDAEHSLFPYYTEDKIIASAENTGCKSIFWVDKDNTRYLWEPFSERGEEKFDCTRNLYKSRYGNTIIFEEINAELGLCFRYQWSSANRYGFVRKSTLTNLSDATVHIRLLDGLQNILPYGVGSDLQTKTSNLADAYKRSELIPKSGLGIFALSAIIVDKAEPSEALKANVAWCLGLDNMSYLLSSLQLKQFRQTGNIIQEEDIKGEKGAYFVVSEITLQPEGNREWIIVANVNQNHAAIVQLDESIKSDNGLYKKVQEDVRLGTENLIKLTAASDALQSTADQLKDTRHFSNVLFNIMRGGIFDNNYQIEKQDVVKYLQKANCPLFDETQALLQSLPAVLSVFELKATAAATGNSHFLRLVTEYLPLKFSRRHGDPSRPWNQFAINTRSETDGTKVLDYQGNWRDIFQNWEALAHAYPAFIEGMIIKFLNASTFDGYNPYRVTKDGFDWETIEPDNPWSYIGYWGDHQIIYLLKFLEFLNNHQPGQVQQLLNESGFVYANVPYTIKPYRDILHNPKDTITFDHARDRFIHERMKTIGADGALLTNASGEIHQVSFGEKILATTLAKLSNLVPDGGIWMNTQRPEWNDANNALVGNGLSMVTLYYLRRFLKFFQPVFEQDPSVALELSEELCVCFEAIAGVFVQHRHSLTGGINDAERKQITDALGMAGSNYRFSIYENGFSGKKKTLTGKQVLDFIHTVTAFLEHAIVVNRRSDDLYHTYNLIAYDNDTVTVSPLNEMLEGQVAVLSSGFLSPEESLRLLDALKKSTLYRSDQNSYILYPNKALPNFLDKNTIPQELADRSLLLKQLLKDGNLAVVEKDIRGHIHFNGNFRNAGDVAKALDKLDQSYSTLLIKEKEQVLQIFEEVFRHKEFTGRSGTFFGYEGLGSIYWHMVSKLLLAVQETCLRAIAHKADRTTIDRLVQHYYDINEGIGVHKPPRVYGAFPTDPYSHTPMGKGAQQPGMTGQVKEDILCRLGELGVFVQEGKLVFSPVLLRRNEFSGKEQQVEYVAVNGEIKNITLEKDALFFTYCQTPVLYVLHEEAGLEVVKADGTVTRTVSAALTVADSQSVFQRTGEVQQIKVLLKASAIRN